MSDAVAADGTKKNPTARWALLGLGTLIVLPMLLLVECGHTEGTMSVTGGPHGDFVFTATDCHAMQPYGRYGANVHGDGHDDGAVYVLVDPITGSEVQIEVPGSCVNTDGTDCTVFRVPEESCSTYEAHVENTQTTVNDVRLVKGHATLECALEDGTRVSGRVDFDGC
jgi:hypothetical protein